MEDSGLVIGGVGAALLGLGFGLYALHGLRRGSRPNVRSWLMWAYGSTAYILILSETGFAALQLAGLMVFAAGAWMTLFLTLLYGGAWRGAEPLERLVFWFDALLLAACLCLSGGVSGFSETTFTVLVAARTLTTSIPAARSVLRGGSGETPLAWFVWSIGHGALALAAMVDDLSWRYVISPVLAQAMFLAIGALAYGRARSRESEPPLLA